MDDEDDSGRTFSTLFRDISFKSALIHIFKRTLFLQVFNLAIFSNETLYVMPEYPSPKAMLYK